MQMRKHEEIQKSNRQREIETLESIARSLEDINRSLGEFASDIECMEMERQAQNAAKKEARA